MILFVTWVSDDGKDHALRFFTEEKLWGWLQEFKTTTGGYPKQLAVYKADCIADMS